MTKKKFIEENPNHPPCASVQLVAQAVATLDSRFDEHCKKQNSNLERIWDAIEGENGVKTMMMNVNEKFNTRLPIWATLLVAALFSTVTGLIVAIVS